MYLLRKPYTTKNLVTIPLMFHSEKNGDFVTAPLISPLFSEMISVWVISFWIKLGKPKNFSL